MPRILVDGDNARQGDTPKRVRYILGWSLAGVIAAFAIVAVLA